MAVTGSSFPASGGGDGTKRAAAVPPESSPPPGVLIDPGAPTLTPFWPGWAGPRFPVHPPPFDLTPAAMLGGGARRETSSPAPSGADPRARGLISPERRPVGDRPLGPGRDVHASSGSLLAAGESPVESAPAAALPGGVIEGCPSPSDRPLGLGMGTHDPHGSGTSGHARPSSLVEAAAARARGRDVGTADLVGDVALSGPETMPVDLRAIAQLGRVGASPAWRRPIGALRRLIGRPRA
jgi:hypothetical protein